MKGLDKMELNIYGLKCDHPSCNYQDNTIQLEQYKDYINYPCPECGSPLLTQADYDTTMEIVAAATIIKQLEEKNPQPSDEMHKVSVRLNGSGVPEFDITKIN